MKRFILLLSLLISSFFCYAQERTYAPFIESFSSSYNKDANKRPCDSLFYVPKIMNFLYNKLDWYPVPYLRERLFDILIRQKPDLIYAYAIDTKNGSLYINSSAAIYWDEPFPNGRKKEIKLYLKDLSNYDSFNEMPSLVRFIKEKTPDYVFIIVDVIDWQSPAVNLYWAIKDGKILVIRFIDYEKYEVFDANDYLRNIAKDDVLSIQKRLKRFREPTIPQI